MDTQHLNEALTMQDRKMQYHVEKRRTFKVRYSEQTRKATSGAVVTPQHCRVTQVRSALMALWAMPKCRRKI